MQPSDGMGGCLVGPAPTRTAKATMKPWACEVRCSLAVLRWIVPASCAALVGLLFAIPVFNHFYVAGAPFYDSGWYSYLLSRWSFPPRNPPLLADQGFETYFSFHIAPAMPLWGAIMQAGSVTPPLAMALYQAALHALLFAAVFVLALSAFRHTGWAVLSAAAVVLCGVTIDATRLPHTEVAIPVLLLLSCALIGRGRTKIALVPFVAVLAVRGDGGLHAASLFGSFALMEVWQRRRWTPATHLAVALAAAGVFAAAVSFSVKAVAFPEYPNFMTVFSGWPPFAHVDAGFVARRTADLLQRRPELLVIALLPLVLAALRRDLTLCAGTLAVVPWVALHLLAIREPPGQLFAYYAFPFLIPLAWPLVLPALRSVDGGQSRVPAPAAWWLAGALVALVAYVLPLNPAERAARREAIVRFLPQLAPADVMRMDHVLDTLGGSLRRDHPVLLDEAMLSLLSRQARSSNVLLHVAPGLDHAPPFVLVYFRGGPWARDIEGSTMARSATRCFMVAGTPFAILTSGEPASNFGLRAPATPARCGAEERPAPPR